MTDAGLGATLSTVGLGVGRHEITAYYPGDAWYHDGCGLYDIGIQAPVCVTANVPGATVYGQPVELDATVAPTCPGPGMPTPTGTLTFVEGTTLSATKTLDGSGTTSLTTSALAVGTHNILVSYSGDTNYLAMPKTQMYTVVVSQDPTTTTVGAAPSPSTYGQPVTISATVTANAPGSGTPTGFVNFYEGTTSLGSANLDGTGKATLPATTSLTVGSHSITANYASDGNFTRSLSQPFNQRVNPAPTQVTLTSTPTTATFGEHVAVERNVAP